VGLSRKRVRGVLIWLRDLMKWFSEDPASRYKEVVDQLQKNSELIKQAMEEVIEPEFKEFVDLVSGLVQVGNVEEVTEGEEGEGDKGDNEQVCGGSEEG